MASQMDQPLGGVEAVSMGTGHCRRVGGCWCPLTSRVSAIVPALGSVWELPVTRNTGPVYTGGWCGGGSWDWGVSHSIPGPCSLGASRIVVALTGSPFSSRRCLYSSGQIVTRCSPSASSRSLLFFLSGPLWHPILRPGLSPSSLIPFFTCSLTSFLFRLSPLPVPFLALPS